jgi:hypothetical protein
MTPEPDDIVRQEDCGRAALRALRVSSEGPVTTVFRDDRRDWYVPTRPPTAADIMLRPPKAVYTVDTAEHPERFDVELPSREEAFFFRAAVAVVWQVRDAVAAVATGLSHPEETYRPQVDSVLRRVARTYSIESSAAAERAMNDEFAVPLPTSQGVVVTRCNVELSLDEQTQEHVASRTLAERSRETRDLEHEAVKQESELSQREALLSNQLELQAAEHQQELAEMAGKHERQLLEERMGFYANALAGGNFNLIALKLADSNEDVDDVISLIMRQRNLDFDGARGMLTSMIEEGLVNRSQVQDILARINTVMNDHLTKPAFMITSPGAAPPPGEGEPITIDARVEDRKATHHPAEDDGAAHADEDDEDDDEDEDELR